MVKLIENVLTIYSRVSMYTGRTRKPSDIETRPESQTNLLSTVEAKKKGQIIPQKAKRTNEFSVYLFK